MMTKFNIALMDESFFTAVPDEPKEVSAKESTPTTVILEVVPPDDNGGVEIYGYRVEFESKSQDFDLGMYSLDVNRFMLLNSPFIL